MLRTHAGNVLTVLVKDKPSSHCPSSPAVEAEDLKSSQRWFESNEGYEVYLSAGWVMLTRALTWRAKRTSSGRADIPQHVDK